LSAATCNVGVKSRDGEKKGWRIWCQRLTGVVH
jgi:hypothetical protein